MTPTEMERWCGEVESWMQEIAEATRVMQRAFLMVGAVAEGAQQVTIPEPPRPPVVAS